MLHYWQSETAEAIEHLRDCYYEDFFQQEEKNRPQTYPHSSGKNLQSAAISSELAPPHFGGG